MPCRFTSCGQAGQRDLDAIIDIDGIDVGIGAELERAQQRIAAVIAADALHVDHLVDADDLRLDRLRDARFDHRRVRAGIGCRHLDLRRDNIGILRDRYHQQRHQPGDRRDQRDDDRQTRPVDEDG